MKHAPSVTLARTADREDAPFTNAVSFTDFPMDILYRTVSHCFYTSHEIHLLFKSIRFVSFTRLHTIPFTPLLISRLTSFDRTQRKKKQF
jgi:hypothetical protein